jgi:predicted nicotinamide N-methyase
MTSHGPSSGAADEASGALAAFRLGNNVPLRHERFTHGRCALSVLMPLTADELIDEAAFARDERLPYWADLWPASKALSRWLVDHTPQPLDRIIELGCGMGLPSLVLKSLGMDVLATDWEPNALASVRVNVEHNDLAKIITATLDWRNTTPGLDPFDLAIGADLMYEQRNAIALADLLPRLLTPSGRFILADPGRRWLSHFELLMKQRDWCQQELAQIEERQVLSTGLAVSDVRIIAFERSSA